MINRRGFFGVVAAAVVGPRIPTPRLTWTYTTPPSPVKNVLELKYAPPVMRLSDGTSIPRLSVDELQRYVNWVASERLERLSLSPKCPPVRDEV